MTNTLAKRIGLTAAALVVYKAMGHIPLPTVDVPALREFAGPIGIPRLESILRVGIAPFISGFLIVELYSLLIPQGRRVRRDGSTGRKKLNEWAIGISFFVCILQSYAAIFALEGMTMPGGLPLVPNPGWISRIIGVVTLTAASASAFILCNFITSRGMGNGFCLLILMDVATAIARLPRKAVPPLPLEATRPPGWAIALPWLFA